MTTLNKSKRLAGLLATAAFAVALSSGCSSNSTPTDLPASDDSTQSQDDSGSNSEAVDQGDDQSGFDDADETADLGDDIAHAPWTTETTEVAQTGPSEEAAFITDLRLAEHDGFDRVVIDFTGTGPVGYSLRWSDRAMEQARGEELAIEGPVFLDVSISGTSFPITDDEFALYFDDNESRSLGGIRAIYDSSFEGLTHLAIGMDAERPYRVFTLTDPLRVVIDVQK